MKNGWTLYFIKQCIKKMLQINKFYSNHKFRYQYLQKKVFIQNNCNIDNDSVFLGKNLISEGTTIRKSSVGFGTYFGKNCTFEFTKVGKYCSIAAETRIVGGHHPTSKFVSIHPAFYSLSQKSNPR